MAREILNSRQYEIDHVYALPEWIAAHQSTLTHLDRNTTAVSPKELGRISGLKSPNQVLVVAKQANFELDQEVIKNQVSLFVDDIQDPGNLGTILRIADWFGIPYVFRSTNTVELYNPKVIQASMGAFLRVKSPEMTLGTIVTTYPDLPILGATMDGKNIFDLKPLHSALIVIGNEGKGISPENEVFIQQKIAIPKGENGGAESLNAAVATGIICAWVFSS